MLVYIRKESRSVRFFYNIAVIAEDVGMICGNSLLPNGVSLFVSRYLIISGEEIFCIFGKVTLRFIKLTKIVFHFYDHSFLIP